MYSTLYAQNNFFTNFHFVEEIRKSLRTRNKWIDYSYLSGRSIVTTVDRIDSRAVDHEWSTPGLSPGPLAIHCVDLHVGTSNGGAVQLVCTVCRWHLGLHLQLQAKECAMLCSSEWCKHDTWLVFELEHNLQCNKIAAHDYRRHRQECVTDFHLSIDGKEILPVSDTKHLGAHLCLLYKTLVRSCLEYALLSWDDCSTEGARTREKTQLSRAGPCCSARLQKTRVNFHRALALVQIDLAAACTDSGKMGRKCEYPP